MTKRQPSLFLASLALLFLMASSLVSCGDMMAKREAERLLDLANEEFDRGEYDAALATIDSLRKVCPTAIETRRQALSLQQAVALKQAQEDLAQTDSLLQAVTNDYNYQKQKVDKERAALKASPEMLKRLTLTQLRRDSLKMRFDLLCSKIKYIHKKQKE